ncbi:MAG: AAA family ATPase [Rhodospirillales bacterium]|nr:MAG: AAA family ATPase [Rhodospirillales bacterium]
MHFTRLRVSGFKSFVDPVELLIEPGTTGIVGPNGCGKSNVVEALRWVMGETSAKSMRGGGMDDVIFGGTTARPARNIAEVVLHIDNSDRRAPATFNDSDELEVSRRIERDAGSIYRVNGKEVRARDVQLLFADLATGAHSTALVGQGRITALIGAKPIERRAILEEAAGIKGLHTRRHEAELRLRAAEANLERLEDVIAALEGQQQGLQRQARQAARYRRLSEEIRRLDAILLHYDWTLATEILVAAESALEAARSRVGDHTAAAARAAAAQAEAAAALPPRREAEAAAAAALQHLQLAHRELESEAAQVAAARTRLDQQLQQIADDIERERTLEADAAEAMGRLEDERGILAVALADEAEQRDAAAEGLDGATRAVAQCESALQDATARLADSEARRDALTGRIAELGERRARLSARQSELEAERARQVEGLDDDAPLTKAAAAVEAAEAEAGRQRTVQEATEAERSTAEEREAAARASVQEAQSALDRLIAEERALAELLEPEETSLFSPVIDAIAVEAGYEAALGAALGEDLDAPIDGAAPIHWKRLPPVSMTPLPGGTLPLAQFVTAPPELTRRLGAIGVVDKAADAARLAGQLAVGQRLVSRDGGLWRWDGFTISPGAVTTAATRLAQRNRLAEIRARRADADRSASKAAEALAAARAAHAAAIESDRAAREAMRAGFAALDAARQAHGELAHARIARESRLASLIETLETVESDLAETARAESIAKDELSQLDDLAAIRERVAAMRAELGDLRAAEASQRAIHERLIGEAERRRERLQAIETEVASWQQRTAGTQARLADLDARRATAESEQRRLAERPAEIEAKGKALMSQIANAEAKRGHAADELATAETALAEADRALRASEAEQAEAREQLVRVEAARDQAERDRAAVAVRVADKLDVAPERILAATGIDEAEELPDGDTAAARLERLGRERDGMGPVNLRAEQEAEELREQVSTLHAEREDLLAAIARLRQGIGTLNREGRDRLMAAFEEVNTHFEELFTRLFGGGRAHLALTEADDPLEAGLEIMASPPGKKLTTMSLLSGGEQALTAVALLFAVFLTNPAPICVLDEVDAPLDDSNVDRFCSLVSELAHTRETRFLLVTHHRMTMARMDRLFGVTMGEAGVSQLVSVDLARAEALRESA